jgi:hypothetical protein
MENGTFQSFGITSELIMEWEDSNSWSWMIASSKKGNNQWRLFWNNY